MSIKARFQQQQPPVDIRQIGGKIYVYICLNGQEKTETYPDMGDGQTQESYYEYDYNEIIGPAGKLPLADIQAHPEQYLNYEYTENKTDVDSLIKRIEKLEQENADMNRVFEEVVNSESGIL